MKNGNGNVKKKMERVSTEMDISYAWEGLLRLSCLLQREIDDHSPRCIDYMAGENSS